MTKILLIHLLEKKEIQIEKVKCKLLKSEMFKLFDD